MRGRRAAATPRVCQQLLWAGAEMACDALGVAPVFAAARNGHFVAVKLLLQHAAEVTDTEKEGIHEIR